MKVLGNLVVRVSIMFLPKKNQTVNLWKLSVAKCFTVLTNFLWKNEIDIFHVFHDMGPQNLKSSGSLKRAKIFLQKHLRKKSAPSPTIKYWNYWNVLCFFSMIKKSPRCTPAVNLSERRSALPLLSRRKENFRKILSSKPNYGFCVLAESGIHIN